MKTSLVLGALFVAACGGRSTGVTAPGGGNVCGGDACGGGDICGGDVCGGGNVCGGDACGGETADFSGWSSWPKVTDTRFLTKGHGKAFVEVFVDAGSVDLYKAKSGPYAVGAKLVKAQYASMGATNLDRLTVMKKMPAGYDPDNGDWFYGVYAADGVTAHKSGKISYCINCHDQVSSADYVFGK